MAVKNTAAYLGIVAALWATMFAARPAATRQWNRPSVLMIRSEVRLLLGDHDAAFRLAEQAARTPVCTTSM